MERGVYVDIGTVWELIDTGGVLGSLVVMASYLAFQNKRLSDRNDELVDRHQRLSEQHATLAAELKAGIERLVDRLNARG